MRRIAVIGTVIKDTIYPYGGGEVHSLGGIFYTLSVLANLVDEGWQIYPVCRLGSDIYEDVLSRLRGFLCIRNEGIRKESALNTRVTLLYETRERRQERLTHRLPPLTLEEMKPVLDCDVLLVNFITGFEMRLDTFRRVAEEAQGLLYVDFHSLTLDIDEEGKRSYRKPAHWRDWIQGVEVLQMNEMEAATLAGTAPEQAESLREFGRSLVTSSVKIFNLTLGSRGSWLFYTKDGQAVVEAIEPLRVEVADVTGCGDAFAAGFIVSYLQSGDPRRAARDANTVAGLNCTFKGTEELMDLRQRLHELARGHPRRSSGRPTL